MDEKTLKIVNIRWQSLAAIDSANKQIYWQWRRKGTQNFSTWKPEVGRWRPDRQNVSGEPVRRNPKSCIAPSCQLYSINIFSQVGMFAKTKIDKKSGISGLAGFLSELPDEDHVIDVNDFSFITTTRKIAQTFLMLGPVSFVNSCCKPNSRYEIHGKVVRCVAIKDINISDEITVKYNVNFFGDFNKNCLCKFTSEHGHPLEDRLPSRKRKLFSGDKENHSYKLKKILSTKTDILNRKREAVDLMYRYSKKVMVAMTADNCAAELLAEEETFSVLSYSEDYGSLETSRHSSLNKTVPQLDEEVNFVMLPSPFLNNFQPVGPLCSTPLRSEPLNLYLFDDQEKKRNWSQRIF